MSSLHLADVLPAHDDATSIPCHNPGTRELLGRIPVDDARAVRLVVERARRAQWTYRKSTHADRLRLLQALLDFVLDESEWICAQIIADSGKTRENALMGEIWTVCEKLRWTLAHGPKHLQTERVSAGLFVHKRARIEYHPLGVIGAIIPWNYPFQNIMNPVIPALMTGNAIVLKPSEWVAASSAAFVEKLRGVLVESGFAPDLIQAVQGYGETGAALVRGGVDGLVFIGSAVNGRKVIEGSAENVVPVTLELGGKDPFIVCEDADLEQAVHASLAGTFISCGQNCVASERLLVFEGIADAFEKRAAELVSQFRQGPGGLNRVLDVGAMTTPLQLEIVERLVEKAVEEGARVVTGGHRVLSEHGEFFAPTILADVTPEMTIMQEETFGPVMVLCRVRDAAHAIEVANSTAYGLSASVFSKDHARARRIADAVHSGMCAINEFGGVTYMAQSLTFGGVKGSGFGRLNGREGLHAMCNIKSVLDDRLPFHFPNVIYPVSPKTFGTTRGVLDVIYGKGLRRKLRGLSRIARSLRKKGERS